MDNPWSLLFVPNKVTLSVGDSDEGFILIHALGREKLLVLSCALPPNPLKVPFLSPLGDDRVFVSVFETPDAKCVSNRSLIGARHNTTGRRVNTAHLGRVGAPNELATFRVTTLSLISSKCVERTKSRRVLSKICLINFSSRCWLRSPRENLFPENWKVEKTLVQNWTHRQPSRQSLAGIFGNFEV